MFRVVAGIMLVLCVSSSAWAIEPKSPSSLDEKVKLPRYIVEPTVDANDPAAPRGAFASFVSAAGGEWTGALNAASGRAVLLSGSGLAIAPGRGNALPAGPVDLQLLESRVRQLIAAHPGLLAPVMGDLVLSPRRSVILEDGRVAFVDFDWVLGGRRVEGAQVFARINSGNVIQLGARLVDGLADSPEPELNADQARASLGRYVGGDGELDRPTGEPDIFYLPVEENGGLRLRLVWEVAFKRAGEAATWTGRVDAHTGEVLEFFDANRYGEVTGGIYPRTVNQPEAVVPFPFVQVDPLGPTTSVGRFTYSGGTVSTGLDGQYFRTNCNGCSNPAQALASTNFGLGWLRLGTGGADAVGNGVSTKAERNSFFHLNEVRQVAKKWLTNAWLDSTVQANVNITSTCNAFYDGAVNFYRSGGGCSNTGEISDVMQHEWGHGLDEHTLLGDAATGEATGDHVGFLMSHDSVIGPYFRTTGAGVRDVNSATSPDGLMTRTNASTKCPPAGVGCGGPLGLECHCEGEIYGQAGWDLAQKLVTKYGYHTGWLAYERMFYVSAPQAGSYLPGQASTVYDAYVAVDDDDGNLANGTPNGQEIFDAFNAHGIAGTARVSSPGCTRPAQPAPTASASCGNVTISWPAVSGATQYKVMKTMFTPNRAFLPVATVTTTSYADADVRPGVTYYYVVQAINASSCTSKIENVVTVQGPAKPVLGIVQVQTDDQPAGNRSGTVDPGESVDVFLTLENASTTPGAGLVGTLSTTTPGVTVTTATRSFPDAPANGTTVNALGFRFAVGGGVTCGSTINFTFSVTDSTGCAVDTQYFSVPVGTQQVRFADTFDASSGWTYDAAHSTATTGAWTRGVPDPTNFQPGNDSDDAGVNCWFTAPNPGGDATDDVDNGEVVLLSPIFDLSTLSSATLSYQRWFANRDVGEDAGDFYWVEASSNGGSTWVTVEKLGTNDNVPAWTKKSFNLGAIIPLTSQVRFRVRVADGTATGNLIEGLFDDFKITEAVCDLTPPCFIAPAFAGLSGATPGPDCAETSLAWSAGSTSCQNATITYDVYRDTNPSFVPAVGNRIANRIPSLSLLDKFLAPGTNYSYVVRAYDSRSGEDSNLVHRQVVAPTSPDTKAPVFAGLTSAGGGQDCGETVLGWTAAQETCSTPVVYDVFRSTTPGFTPAPANRIARTTDVGFVDAALAPDTTYYYIVRGEDQANLSDANSVQKTVAATVLPEVISTENFETGAAGWARSGLNDAASGLWELGDPTPTDAQPGTCPSGSNCWVTGLAETGLGSNDVDTGTTTLLSAPFSMTGLIKPAVRYLRYYSNDTGSEPNADTWQVDISNDDGGTWHPVESTTVSDEGLVFRTVEHPLGTLTPTNTMRMRFTASDLAGGSVVEAEVDDFSIVDQAGGCDGCPAAPRVGAILVTKGGDDVILGWTADPVSAPRYKIYSSVAPNFAGFSVLGTAAQKTYHHTDGALYGSFIAYKVSAVDACAQEGPLD